MAPHRLRVVLARDGDQLQCLPGSGLAIWHVDEQGNNSHEAMTSAAHYELSLKQADGLFQLERTRSARGDANDLYAGAAARFADDTTPSSKWWDGTPSHCRSSKALKPKRP